MESMQIKALGLEQSVLKFLDEVIADYGLYIFMGLVFLLIPVLAWVSSGGLRRKLLKGKSLTNVPPVIVVHLPGEPPRPPDNFEQFPPLHDPPDCGHDE